MFKKLFKKKIIIPLLIVFILGGYFGYKNFVKKGNQTRYTLAAVEKGTIVVSVSGSGQITTLDEIDIKSKTAGEIKSIYIEKDQEVKSSQLLVEIDSKIKERAVRDARIALDDAKEDLEKAKEDYEKLKKDSASSLDSAYKDGLDTLVETFEDLNSLIPNLELIFKAKNYSSKESDFDYYISLVRSICTYRGESNSLPYWTESAEDKFLTFKNQFSSIQKEYWKLHQNSPREQIKAVLNQTYDFSRLLLDLIRQTSNLIAEYQKILEDEGFTPPISETTTNNQASQLKAFDSTLSTLVTSLEKNKDAIDDLEENTPKKLRDAELAIQTAQNNLTEKEEALADAKEDFANCFIYAPFDGVITKVNVKKGDSISSGTVLATLITKQKIAKISLNEVDAAKVKVGQKATLTFDALPEVTLTGKVVEVDTVGTVSQGVVSYGVNIALDTEEERIKPGMSVTADIITDAKTDVLVLPNSAVKLQGDTNYVELVEISEEMKQQLLANKSGAILPNPPRSQPVEIGLSNNLSTEIISGLKKEDIVVASTISPNAVQTTQTRGTQEFRIPGMGR